MADFYLGDIMMYPTNWAPQDFMPCDGRLLDIAKYQALYSLLGINFGGDGKTTFGLPDMRGMTPVCVPRQAPLHYEVGQIAGQEKVALTAANLPSHAHAIDATFPLSFLGSSTPSDQSVPTAGSMLGRTVNSTTVDVALYTPDSQSGLVALQSSSLNNQSGLTTTTAGAGVPLDNRQPFLAIGFYICTKGYYPPIPDTSSAPLTEPPASAS